MIRSWTLLRTPLAYRRIPTSKSRHFHPTSAAMVQVGDSIPSIELLENSPGNKVDLSKELEKGKGLIIGVPAAFSSLGLCTSIE